MLSFLKQHPFAVETFFESSVVLTYAVPKEHLQRLIPECLQLDTFDEQWAFLAVALVKTKALRPKGFPRFMGNDFILIGYRVFVRYTTSEGKRLRGLYILKSQTDKRRMAFWGNRFTHYNYSATPIDFSREESRLSIRSRESGLDVVVDLQNEDAALPEGSPFPSWKEARRFAGPLPFTFTYNKDTGAVLLIEGVREGWTPRPIEVVHARSGFVEGLHLPGAVLANAFILENIPYYWKKGRVDKWKR
jgi:hypothetical protein